MTPALLDLNVLVALTWPSHIHHEAAHRWFARNKRYGWASCPITQSGLVRLSSNPKIIADAVSPSTALELVKRLTEMPEHCFWPDDLALLDGQIFKEANLLGHRQVTDAYLLSLTIHNSARFATFDTGIKTIALSYMESVCVISQES